MESLNDSQIMLRPSSATQFYTLTYCMVCKELYFKESDERFQHHPAKEPIPSTLAVNIGEREIIRVGEETYPGTVIPMREVLAMKEYCRNEIVEAQKPPIKKSKKKVRRK
jgi:hypothetical protein